MKIGGGGGGGGIGGLTAYHALHIYLPSNVSTHPSIVTSKSIGIVPTTISLTSDMLGQFRARRFAAGNRSRMEGNGSATKTILEDSSSTVGI